MRTAGWMTVGILVGAACAAVGQQPVARGTNVKTSLVRTPRYQISGSQSMRTTGQERWLRINVEYESYPQWLDGLKLRAYVLARTESGPVVLTGEVEYANVPADKHVASMFIHRRVVERFGGRRPSFEQIAIEMSIGGNVIDRFGPDGPLRQAWWQGLPTVPDTVIARDRTPWAMLDFDAFEQIKR